MLRIFCKQRLCSTNWIERRLMGQVTSGLGLCGPSRLFRGARPSVEMPTFCEPHAELAASPGIQTCASWVQSLHKFGAANFKKAWRTDEASTLASRDITPVEHDDDSEHRSDIDDLRYVIQNNGEALSAGVPKFLMSVARQYRHQA